MYLKSLEIQGFKSFPDKAVITFGQGITSIVGPNGSGKSNISDAVRWVLGEQSTKLLRGVKMEDVIFGGTLKRAPVGFAEVSLTFENSARLLDLDYNEVTVTRRYFRSGESEYFLNRSPVRLRDVHEVFMDTGLGRDGYSVIGQGRIDEILSAKSDDRREIFEEAAGISKYKYRKEESERRLKATEENLLRISDIITELETSLEPLKEQSEKARRFLDLHNHLKTLEISLWLDSLDRIREQSVSAKTDCDGAAAELLKMQAALESLYKEVESLAAEMHDKDEKAEAIRLEIRVMESETSKLENDVVVLKANLNNNLDNIGRIESEISDRMQRETGISDQINARKQRIEELLLKEGETGLRVEKRQKEINELSVFKDSVSLKLESLMLGKEKNNIEAEKSKIELSRLSSLKTEILEQLKSLREELESRNLALLEEKKLESELKTSLSENEEKLLSLKNIINGFKIRLENRKKKENEASLSLKSSESELLFIQNRFKILSEMEREYEGFSKAVKLVMKESESGKIKNIHGPVSKLMDVDNEYLTAVETALGGALQNIVVEKEEDAKEAIGILKRLDAGRATFLPLSAVKASILKEQGLKTEPGFIGLASELISFDEKYSGIFGNLLGRTAVVNNIDTAIRLARKYGYRFRIVTKDGQVINSGGSMTGGSVSKSAGFLSRSNEIKSLGEKMKKAEAGVNTLRRGLAEMERELAAAEQDVKVSEGEYRLLEDEILKISTQIKQHSVLIQSLEGFIQKTGADIKTKEERLTAVENEITLLNEKTAVILNLLSSAEGEILKLTEGKEDLSLKQDVIADELSKMKTELAQAAAEREAVESALLELTGLETSLTDDRKQREELIETFNIQNTAIKSEINEKQEKLKANSTLKNEKLKALDMLNNEKLKTEGLRIKKERESQQSNELILALERERSRLESKKTQAEMEERQLYDKLWENYELTYTTAQNLRVKIDSASKAEKEAEHIKNEIRSLGSVNTGAIEEHDRVLKRYEHLKSQKDDLDKAKSELRKIISEIVSQMRGIFSEEFKSINSCFNETFSDIFGGGHAELLLTDPSDILNSGIDIEVSLPGKSLKTITLLSGGEKAFVAIALYFAMLRVRPTPFCVLDEIEAALDDVNVFRFVRYLKKLIKNTQIIMITHRRGTMEESDMLYGVTMQEQGVSKILALNINEIEEQLKFKPN